MKDECSLWIEEKDFDAIIEKIQNHDESDPLYEGHNIEELYVNSSNGTLEGFITIGDIGVGIWIPFGEWFSNFVKFKAFDKMIDFMENHQHEVEDAVDNSYVILNKINSSIETKKTEEK